MNCRQIIWLEINYKCVLMDSVHYATSSSSTVPLKFVGETFLLSIGDWLFVPVGMYLGFLLTYVTCLVDLFK